MNFIKNLLARVSRHRKLFAFFVFCFLFAAGIVKAQYSLQDQWNALDQEGQNQQKFGTQNFANGFVNPLLIGLGGCPSCKNPQLKTGALPFTTNMIAQMYGHPPASGLAYVEDVINRINPVQPAYAQTGTGFVGLQPLLPIWKAFRDFAYAFFAVIFVAIGLAIMFRMKLDPRTVLTLQSAIPRIVVALLLVTFSYAIAGFMIDLLYVFMSLTILMFGRAGADVPHFQGMYLTGGFGAIWGSLWGMIGGGTVAVVSGLTSAAGLLAGGFILGGPAVTAIGTVIGTSLAWVGIGAGVFLLILLIIVLYITFKIFMDLLRAYIGIIIAVVLGPLQICLGVIPGFPGFGAWIKGLFTNILIFVGVAFVLMLGQTIIGLGTTSSLWHAPLLIGSGTIAAIIPIIISIGILQVTHQVPEAVRQIMAGRPPEFAPGQALNTTVGSPAAGAMEDRAREAGRNNRWGSSAAWRVGGGIIGGIGGGRRR